MSSVEEHLRDDLRAVRAPTAVPADFADTVLRLDRRRRRVRRVALGAAVALAVAVVPFALLGGGGSGSGLEVAAGVPAFPEPGGGPRALHVYGTDDATTYLLDTATGRYRRTPYPVVLSPDLKRVAVTDGTRTGVADRAALLRDGSRAIQWTKLAPGNGLAWSPDGTALLVTSITKQGGSGTFTAQRFDPMTGTIESTPINTEILGGAVAWAPDSRRYVVLEPGASGGNTVEPADLRYVEPGGQLGDRIGGPGGIVGGYSPSGRYLAADTSTLETGARRSSPVFDLDTGDVIGQLPAGARPVGWYDERTVACVVYGTRDAVLRLIDARTGTVRRQIDLPGVTRFATVQLGSSTGLPARLGF